MQPFAYLVCVETTGSVAVADYSDAARTMVEALQTLTDEEIFKQITNGAETTDARIEAEVAQDKQTGVLQAHLAVQMHAEKRPPLDKNKILGALKPHLPFGIKVTKRAVPDAQAESS